MVLLKIRYLVIVFSILVNFISTNHLSAEIYKWTDKNAKTVKERKNLRKAYLNESRQQVQKLISFQKKWYRVETNKIYPIK